ncbi:MAG TPA: very short patch repair endonuclease [Pyrinomonadaceae bacterium]|jgi:DNA mismatch endonuclease (patch repair protein)
MADHLTPEQRFRAMSRVKLKDGSLEMIVRSELHRRGYRFRKHVKTLPGSPDAVFPKEKIAIFIDGDFWHGYRLPAWEHKLKDFWKNKIRENRQRDQKNFRKLRRSGWRVLRIWQHEIKSDPEACVDRIAAAVDQARRSNHFTQRPSE